MTDRERRYLDAAAALDDARRDGELTDEEYTEHHAALTVSYEKAVDSAAEDLQEYGRFGGLYWLKKSDGVKDLIDWLRDNDVLVPATRPNVTVNFGAVERVINQWNSYTPEDVTRFASELMAAAFGPGKVNELIHLSEDEWRGKGGVFWPKTTDE